MALIRRERRQKIPRDTNLKTRTVLRAVVTSKGKQLRDKVMAEMINNKCCPPKTPSEQDECSICKFTPSQYEAQEAAAIWLFLETRKLLLEPVQDVKERSPARRDNCSHPSRGQGDLGGWKTAGISARPMGTNELREKKSKPLKILLIFDISNYKLL